MTPSSKAVQLYQEGLNAADISDAIGYSKTQIYRFLDEAGIERRTSGKRRFTPAVEKQLVEDYVSGLTYDQIAEKYECSHWVIARLIKEAGIIPRSSAQYGTNRSPEARKAISDRMKGDKHPFWKGGRMVTKGGYIKVKLPDDDPYVQMRDRGGYVLEHRIVMARYLGRPLNELDTVHHINGDKEDNSLQNLELRVGRHGKGATEAHCATCKCFEREARFQFELGFRGCF